MPYSYTETVSSGSTNVFSVPFPYLDKTHVRVLVNGALTPPSSLMWTSENTVQLPDTPGSLAGKTIRVERVTPANGRIVDFKSGGLSPRDINDADKQLLYISQEAIDRSTAGENGLKARVTVLEEETSELISETITLKSKVGDLETRTVKAPPGETGPLLPPVASRRNRLAGFDTGGSIVPVDAVVSHVQAGVEYSSTFAVASSHIPAPVNYIRTAGYWSAGDGGGALYRRAVEQPGAIQSADGMWWSIAESRLNAFMFGALGNGVADDTVALQAAMDAASVLGQELVLQGPGPYLITAPIRIMTKRTTAPRGSESIHFTDHSPMRIVGVGGPVIKAGAVMRCLFEFVYNGLGNLSPFYSKVEDVFFDGQNLAQTCILSSWTMHMKYEGCRFDRAERGIEHVGYGVFRARNNVFRCKYGFYLVGGGGDSTIESNDFYMQEANGAALFVGHINGNSTFRSNIITNSEVFANCYGVRFDGTLAPNFEYNLHWNIESNEFCGLTAGISAVGKAATNRNGWHWRIVGNHVTEFGTNKIGKLIYAKYVDGFRIIDNYCNGVALSPASDYAIELDNCRRFKIESNAFARYSGGAIKLTDCMYTTVNQNDFQQIGLTEGQTCAIILLTGAGSWKNEIKLNSFRSDSVSAGYGVYESDGVPPNTIGYENSFEGVYHPYRKAAAQSPMVNRVVFTSIPSGGSVYYNQGDRAENPAAAAGFVAEWVCTASGAPGVWKVLSTAAA